MFPTMASKRRIQGGMNRPRLIQHAQTLGMKMVRLAGAVEIQDYDPDDDEH